MKKQQKVILLGDSITQGLGSKKINFTQALQDKLGPSFFVENMALTGTTILYADQILDRVVSLEPDYVIIVYGNVDAQIRPNRNGLLFPHIPGRFQKNGMLMPRPFYSRTIVKKFGQNLDNWLRHFFSFLIYQVDGSEQWVSKEQFKKTYSAVVEKLLKKRSRVLACSTVYIDEALFPGSLNQYNIFNSEIASIAHQSRCSFVDLFTPLKQAVQKSSWEAYYNYDHFHPNSGGYELISEILSREILQENTSRR